MTGVASTTGAGAPGARRELVERRQVWARDLRPDAPEMFFYLTRGSAGAVRPLARAGVLVCPVPDCPDPRFTTRGGSRRDHFAHMGHAGGHAPETILHVEGKAALAAWARAAYPDARVTVEASPAETHRRPDVLLDFGDRRYGLEIQYAALAPEDWSARHADYERAGITDIWLFGATARWMLRPRSWDAPDLPIRLPPLLATLLLRGVPFFWLDPQERTVAVPIRARFVRRRWALAFNVAWGSGSPEITLDAMTVPLASLRLRGAALAVPALIGADQYWTGIVGPQETRERRCREQAEGWCRFRAEIVEKLGAVPPIIEAGSHEEMYWTAPVGYWHGAIFARFLNHRVGTRINERDAIAFVRDTFGPQLNLEGAVVHYLFVLVGEGYLRTVWPPRSRPLFEVRHDVHDPPSPRPQPGKPPQPALDDLVARANALVPEIRTRRRNQQAEPEPEPDVPPEVAASEAYQGLLRWRRAMRG